MDKNKSGEKNALKTAQSGTEVPQKDYSSKNKESKASSGGKGGSAVLAKSLPTEKANSAPVASDPKPHEVKKTWEGSPEDWTSDYRQAKRKGISVDQWEDSPSDRLSDNAGERKMKSDDSDTVKHAPEYKQGVSAYSNSPKASHGFGHPASARQGHLRMSGSSSAHCIGRKK